MSVPECSPELLRTLFLFEELTDDQLETLCQSGHITEIDRGQVYLEGDPASCFYVLIEGELIMSKLSGGEDIEMVRTSQTGLYSGGWT